MWEIEKKLTEAITKKVTFEEVEQLHPKHADNIKAIVFDGVLCDGKMSQVFAYYGKPVNDKQGEKLPAIVLIHGGLGHAYSQWVKVWTDRGYAAIAIETEGAIPKDADAGLYGKAELWGRELPEYLSHRNGCIGVKNDEMGNCESELESQWMFHAVNASILAHNILLQDEDVDDSKIGVHGISWGGVITSLLIGYDTRFAFAIPVYGSGFLGTGLAVVDEMFRKPEVENLWLAEKRFHQATCPILWIGSNDDHCFSPQPRNFSYLSTVGNNEKTRLSVIDQMPHNHEDGCAPNEIYRFADAIVGSEGMLPELLYHNSETKIELEIQQFMDGKETEEAIKSVKLFFITEKMTYTIFDKFNQGTEKEFMTQDWQRKEFFVENGKVSMEIPEEAVGYYGEVITIKNGKEYTVTTPYIEKV